MASPLVAGVGSGCWRRGQPVGGALGDDPPVASVPPLRPLLDTGVAGAGRTAPRRCFAADDRATPSAALQAGARSGLLFDIDTGRVLWRHAPRGCSRSRRDEVITALVFAAACGQGAARTPPRRSPTSLGRRPAPAPASAAASSRCCTGCAAVGHDAAIALAIRAASLSALRRPYEPRARAIGLVALSSPRSRIRLLAPLARPDLAASDARAALPGLLRIVRRLSAVEPFRSRAQALYNNNRCCAAAIAGHRRQDRLHRGAVATRCERPSRACGSALVLLGSPDPGAQARACSTALALAR